MMKGRIYLFLILAIITTSLAYSQSAFSPENLGPGVNSIYPELNPILSPDGKTLYFVRANHPENQYGPYDSQDIWMSQLREDGNWDQAVRMVYPFNTARYNAVYAVIGDGNSLLINGIFDKKGEWKKRGLSIIHNLGKNDWGKPERVKIKRYHRLNKGYFGSVHMNNTEDILVMSFSRRHYGKKANLFVSHKKVKSGKWTKPKKIKGPVSARGTEKTPYLSKDGTVLFFSTKKRKDNSFEIYYCTRTKDNYRKWTEPKKLDTVNTNGWDAYYSLNEKGSWAYYASTANSQGSSDLLRIKLFEENPFIEVSGKVINKERNQIILPSEKDFKILVNGKAPDSIAVDAETGTYRLLLPLGKRYSIEANSIHYQPEPSEVNAENIREFTKLTQDLYIIPDPYMLVKGNILVKDDPYNITSADNPIISINGKDADSVIYNNDGSYDLYLEHGKAYVIQVKAEKYNPGEEKIDLRDIHEYTELEKDLFVSKIPAPKIKEATMTGIIKNSKTMKALDPGIAVEIHINDFPSINVEIKDSTYTLKLPLGAAYKINASAQMYYPVLQNVDLSQEKAHVKIIHDLYLTPLEVGSSIELENIFFESGKATLKPESYTELDRVARLLNDSPSLKIEIGGHTDNVGNADFNKKLSENRAEAVTNYILSKGVTPERVAAVGYGMEKPVASNDTEEGKMQNRRVEFTILGN